MEENLKNNNEITEEEISETLAESNVDKIELDKKVDETSNNRKDIVDIRSVLTENDKLIDLIFKLNPDSDYQKLIKYFDDKKLNDENVLQFTDDFIKKTSFKLDTIKEKFYELKNITRDPSEKDISAQLEFIYRRRKHKQDENEYDDKPLYYLFGKKDNMNLHNEKNKKKSEVIRSKKDKNINYEVREELEGFVCKEGTYLWDDEKIDEFIRSILDK